MTLRPMTRRLGLHRADGLARARSHCRFVTPLIHFMPESLKYSETLFLKRQCDRTLGLAPLQHRSRPGGRGLQRPHPRPAHRRDRPGPPGAFKRPQRFHNESFVWRFCMGAQELDSPKRRFPAGAVARVRVLRAARPAPRRQRKHALVTESHMGSYPRPQTLTTCVRQVLILCARWMRNAKPFARLHALPHVESLAEGGWQRRLVLRVRRVDGLDMSIVFIGSKCVPTYTLKDTSDPYPRYQSKNS
jgi:hypothetical protein